MTLDEEHPHYPATSVASDNAPDAHLATSPSRRIVASSGRQDPQFVPARKAAPIAATLVSFPDWMAPTMVARPTAKQAQTVGPGEATPASETPARTRARLWSGSASPNIMMAAARSGRLAGSRAMKRQASSAPSTKLA